LRAERDALRLAAVLIAHWDNKASNQRLVCRSPASDGSCAEPIAIIQDLGSTFGPSRIDLAAWTKAPIWADRTRCAVSMKMFPYGGGTFPDGTISERGRQLLARQLEALTDEQMTTLFTAARFPDADGHEGADANADANAWTQALRAKIKEIADAGPCPAS
jgi:hypothetical protein